MLAVRVVQMPVDQVVHMVAVRHCFMAATGTMLVVLGVLATIMAGRTRCRVPRGYRDAVFFHTGCRRVVQVAVV
jgi:hypothetical protein